MTATPAEDAAAASAQSQGETAARQHEAAAQAQHRTTVGSDVTIEQASSPDDIAVSWFGSGSNAASPSLSPSVPPPTNSYERSPSDPT
jgi:hypothetical protein